MGEVRGGGKGRLVSTVRGGLNAVGRRRLQWTCGRESKSGLLISAQWSVRVCIASSLTSQKAISLSKPSLVWSLSFEASLLKPLFDSSFLLSSLLSSLLFHPLSLSSNRRTKREAHRGKGERMDDQTKGLFQGFRILYHTITLSHYHTIILSLSLSYVAHVCEKRARKSCLSSLSLFFVLSSRFFFFFSIFSSLPSPPQTDRPRQRIVLPTDVRVRRAERERPKDN